MAYESLGGSNGPDHDSVILVQSNPSPGSVTDITWSLVSAWPRPTSDPQDRSPNVCHVDPTTGVFSMMSYFNLTLTDESYPRSRPTRAPGGLQYDPRSNRWSNFSIAPDYRWDDATANFILFNWPGTSTLFQATIGTANTINIGKLYSNGEDFNMFSNIANWTLDPLIYGDPKWLFYGNNMLYQVGTYLYNNKTGALKTIMTQIPISGNPLVFQPPTNPRVLKSDSLDTCDLSFLYGSYYKDTLYIFCQGQDGDSFAGFGGVSLYEDIKDNNGSDASLDGPYRYNLDQVKGASFQPIEGYYNEELKRFALMINSADGFPMVGLPLHQPFSAGATKVTYEINITDNYGTPFHLPENNNTGAIIGGSVVGGLISLALMMYLLVRWRWPQWQRWLKSKILQILSADDSEEELGPRGKHSLNGDDSSDNMDRPGARENVNKIEDPLLQNYDFDGRDKVLATENGMSTNAIDTATAYMQGVPLQRHPRPTFFTTLNPDLDDSDYSTSDLTDDSSLSRAPVQRIENHHVLSTANVMSVATAVLRTLPTSFSSSSGVSSSVSRARDIGSDGDGGIRKSNSTGALSLTPAPHIPLLSSLRHQPSAPLLEPSSSSFTNNDKDFNIATSQSEEIPMTSIGGTAITTARSNHYNSIEEPVIPLSSLPLSSSLIPPLPSPSPMSPLCRRTSISSTSSTCIPEEAAPPYYQCQQHQHQLPNHNSILQQQLSPQLSQPSSYSQTSEPTQLMQPKDQQNQNLSQLLLSIPTSPFSTLPIPSAPMLDIREQERIEHQQQDRGQDYKEQRDSEQTSKQENSTSSSQVNLPSEVVQVFELSSSFEQNAPQLNPSSGTIFEVQEVLSQEEDNEQTLERNAGPRTRIRRYT
ncbi:hypothetical protein BX616_001606 [Lobosporangium transversale]|uniref:Uncharacterized protein n=1 Tax=Lobosporangium transversale TaxID=64571 RepID=A0A1Y2H1E8_9FUNG|nr:hypothetical protein BCR41DRAFT_418462 [Lobosporangium transversale]KAF9903508.1 hypothetical protein BX616_001606 [Lobosporangium transversale]ORZ28377.1 hypothetical protein BCR41DRAFT_418462 [Lobosporangium transversale]|eukprot:XP_021886062.1 hypothetical protein BCR41DRAFT_418462 [Lobosporangium transversale]